MIVLHVKSVVACVEGEGKVLQMMENADAMQHLFHPFPTDAWESVSFDSGLLMPAKMTCSQGKLFAEKE